MRKALVLCPDEKMMAELLALLAREAPAFSPAELRYYPGLPAVAELLEAHAPEICFVDAISGSQRALPLVSRIAEAAPHVFIVSLLGREDAGLILSFLRHGASGFLVRPFTADELHSLFAKLGQRPAAGAEPSGEVYCVMPGKGASGATTIACHLACHFKRLSAEKVLLADLDPLMGTVAFVLKLKSHYSFADALAHGAGLDGDLWKNLVIPSRAGDVILPPQDPLGALAEVQDASPIVNYSRRHYRKVVLDTSGPYGEWNLTLAGLCDKLLLISTNELPALHSTRRALAWLETKGVARSKIRLAINRYQRETGLSQDAIEGAFGLEIAGVLPSDYRTMQKALLDGKPAPPGSPFGTALAELAARLEGIPAPAQKSSGWLSSLKAGL
jgi:Flp pilus assembly CpaE family ATPase